MKDKTKEKGSKSTSELDKIFTQLVKDHNTIAPGSATTGNKMFAETKFWIDTGSIILNTIISNDALKGGWPAGRTVELYGEEAIGKSTLVWAGLAGVQKAGGVAIYYDIEQTGAKNMMEACGIDMKHLIYSNNSSLEEIFATIEMNLLTIINSGLFTNKPVLISIDSLAQMMPDAEVESGYEHNMNIALKKAMQLGKAIRKITPLLNKANACLIIINQLRDVPGITYGDSTCVDPYTTKIKIRYKALTKETYVEEEITLAKFAENFLGINDFVTPKKINIEELGIKVLGRDFAENIDSWELITHFLVKPSVKTYYTNGVLKGTGEHKIAVNKDPVALKDHPDYKEINESMHVVDISVDNIENYYANGEKNFNTTPGGKALKFAATLRIKLLGKTPVKIMDPNVERVYKNMLLEWETACKIWKDTGGKKANGPKPLKPKKPKGDEIIIGYDVIARTDKNKVAPPKREAEFRIVFGIGIIEEYAWFDYACKFGFIENAENYEFKIPSFPDIPNFRRASWISILENNPKLKSFLKENIPIKLVRTVDEYKDIENNLKNEDEDENENENEINEIGEIIEPEKIITENQEKIKEFEKEN
jgi:RecA/RadA recombinase